MKIAIGSDHAGFRYKQMIKAFLQESGHEVKDFGTHSDEPADYPVYIRPVAEAVARGEYERGIVLGGSGNGEAMVANRVKGIRCALCWNQESARLARKHNDANMISLGERMLTRDEARDIVHTWLDTPFEGGRHVPRIMMIDQDVSSPPISSDKDAGKDEKTGECGGRDAGKRGSPEHYDVTVSFGYILYAEGKNILEFTIDSGLKGPSIIHVPSEKTWLKEMPEWASDRRDEILGRIEGKCVHLDYNLEEY